MSTDSQCDETGTYVHVDDGHDGLGPTREADPDAGGEDLGEAVEADDAPYFRLVALELEVGGRAGCAPKV